jgi:hypothetical protein
MSALKFRVLLDNEQNTEIFRDILIDKNDNFESLYQAIISSFRFEGNQMASFYMSNDEWDKGHEISFMDMNYGDEAIDEKASVMSSAILRDFMLESDQKMILVYDFMRMWIFLIELIDRNETYVKVPEVALSIGMAPPEDSRMANLDEEDSDFLGLDEEIDEDEDEDDIFGDDFEDGYSDEDYNNFDEY